jgi:hypothetical protein
MTKFTTFLRHDGSVDLFVEDEHVFIFEDILTLRQFGEGLIEHADRHAAKIRESGEHTDG